MSYKERLKQAKKEGRTQNLTPDFMTWEKAGQIIIGEMISKNPVQSSMSDGEYMQYLFKTDDGLVKFAMGGAADGELKETMVNGGLYEIEFKGQEKIRGGRKVNKFKVECFGSVDEITEDETPEETSD